MEKINVARSEAILLSLYQFPVECLKKDQDLMLTFYEFPTKHWKHIRTTNPIESTFATVKHRPKKAKECFSPNWALGMAYQLCLSAEKDWKKLYAAELCGEVAKGTLYEDGVAAGHLDKKAA